MFSVIIPLYNKEVSIESTIRSVLNQTFTDFEVIVINDGSTDRSCDVVESINDSRIKLIHQDNQGVSAARNHGIREANLEWVAFLDGDDLWHAEHLSEFKKKIAAFPEISWLFSGFTIDNGKKQIKKVFSFDGKLANIFDSLLSGIIIHTSTVCIKRSMFDVHEDLFFKVGLNNSEDREVWYKLSCLCNSPVYIGKSLSMYFVGDENSLTGENTKGSNDQFLTMSTRIQSYTDNIGSEDKKKLLKFIVNFNRNALLNRYKYGTFKDEYKEYLSTYEYLLLRVTVRFPFLLRYMIYRFLYL